MKKLYTHKINAEVIKDISLGPFGIDRIQITAMFTDNGFTSRKKCKANIKLVHDFLVAKGIIKSNSLRKLYKQIIMEETWKA